MEAITELSYALDTFYFLVSGVLVMWMAAGFSMLEAGLVRAKNTAEILTKNISLFAVACIMYMLMGYSIMYPAEAVNAWWPGFGGILGSTDNTDYYLERAGSICQDFTTYDTQVCAKLRAWQPPCRSSQVRWQNA